MTQVFVVCACGMSFECSVRLVGCFLSLSPAGVCVRLVGCFLSLSPAGICVRLVGCFLSHLPGFVLG